MILVAAGLFGLKVLVVYADAAYFDRRLFRVVHHILGAHQAIHYNLRKAGKKKLASLEFLEQWQRLVTAPRTAIERHFAWLIGCLHPSDFAVLSPPQRLDVESGDGRSALLDREATDTRVRSRLAKEASSCRRDP